MEFLAFCLVLDLILYILVQAVSEHALLQCVEHAAKPSCTLLQISKMLSVLIYMVVYMFKLNILDFHVL